MNVTIISSNGTSDWGGHQGADTAEGCVVLGVDTGGFIPWDNPDNMVSQDVEQAVDTAVGAVCLPILFLISAPTNILNMLVFWKQGLKERINLCLFYLSCVDFVHMLHAFFCNVDRFYLPINQPVKFGPVFRFIVNHRLLGLRSLTWLSGVVSMLIACERCFCVLSPLRSQTVLSTRTTGCILSFSTVFCLTGSLLNGMRWDLVCVLNPETKATSTEILTSQFFARHRSHLKLMVLFYGAVQPILCVTVIVVTTAVTSVKLRAMVAWREQTSSQTQSWREVALTRMLIAASVLYIICALPTTVIGLSTLFVPGISLDGRYYNVGLVLVNLFELTSYVNASFNFFIYVSLGSKYRNTLRVIFWCCCPLHHHHHHQKELK
ncbi:uncharacterized protein LOC143297116 [Babylonia areolata]|uniref:uncharacterized protein LOC143297116 n=1 Tax=Babylonia areolata TaxID=304850 RepID=UPI003FCEECFF